MKNINYLVLFFGVSLSVQAWCAQNEPQTPTGPLASSFGSSVGYDTPRTPQKNSESGSDLLSPRTPLQKITGWLGFRGKLPSWKLAVLKLLEQQRPGFVCTHQSDGSLKITGDFKICPTTWSVPDVTAENSAKIIDWCASMQVWSNANGTYDIRFNTPDVPHFGFVQVSGFEAQVSCFKPNQTCTLVDCSEQQVKKLLQIMHPGSSMYSE